MNRLKFLREEKGLFQKDVADYLNCSIAIISMYEKEQRVMDVNIAQKLATYFECSIDYLLGKSDVRNSNKQIDDVLNEAMIGMSKEEYEKLTETQKKQIRDFALFVKKQSEENKNEE